MDRNQEATQLVSIYPKDLSVGLKKVDILKMLETISDDDYIRACQIDNFGQKVDKNILWRFILEKDTSYSKE